MVKRTTQIPSKPNQFELGEIVRYEGKNYILDSARGGLAHLREDDPTWPFPKRIVAEFDNISRIESRTE